MEVEVLADDAGAPGEASEVKSTTSSLSYSMNEIEILFAIKIPSQFAKLAERN